MQCWWECKLVQTLWKTVFQDLLDNGVLDLKRAVIPETLIHPGYLFQNSIWGSLTVPLLTSPDLLTSQVSIRF